jgi:hypothetical protein
MILDYVKSKQSLLMSKPSTRAGGSRGLENGYMCIK